MKFNNFSSKIIIQAKSLTTAFEQLFRKYWSAKWTELEPREFKVGDVKDSQLTLLFPRT